MSALEVCSVIKDAFRQHNKDAQIIVSPMADGGEGTVDTLVESLDGKYVKADVTGPSGRIVPAVFGIIENGRTAVIEMSSASGLWLLNTEEKNPLNTTTYGTGQLIKKAIEMGTEKIILGIGGSATNDAGMGAAHALGVKFYDKDKQILQGFGKDLSRVSFIDTSSVIEKAKKVKIYVACDVDNTLYGKNGAAYVYGPQKGADPQTVEALDNGLKNFSKIVEQYLSKDISNIKSGGAAGGLGAGLYAFFDARLEPGTKIIIKATKLEEKITDADLVITGEGSMDNQTFYGKSAYGVAMLAKKYGIAVITINGSVNIDYSSVEDFKKGLFAGNFDTISRAMDLEQAIKKGKECLYFEAGEIAKFYFSIIEKNK